MATLIEGHFAKQLPRADRQRLEKRRILMAAYLDDKPLALCLRRHLLGRLYGQTLRGMMSRNEGEAAATERLIETLLDDLAVLITLHHERERSRSRT